MMQVAIDQVAEVVAVRHGFVATVRAVNMVFGVTRTNVVGSTGRRILLRNFDTVMLHGRVTGRMMQVAIMQIVHVVIVFYGGVATALAVLVIVMLTGLLI